MSRKTRIATGCAIEKLAAILEAIERDHGDAEHMTGDGRSLVIENAVHNAKEYFTRDFRTLLDDARDALDDYNKAIENDEPDPVKCWAAITTQTDENDPEYVSVVSLFTSREKAVTCIENAVAEDTADGSNWSPEDVRWNGSRTICEYEGGTVVHRVTELTISE